MGIVWHGSYSLYFEDAREEFGRQYNIEYLYIFDQGFYAPIVELHIEYKNPLRCFTPASRFEQLQNSNPAVSDTWRASPRARPNSFTLEV